MSIAQCGSSCSFCLLRVINGPDSTQKLRELGFQGAVFGVTGNVLAEDAAIFLNHGADAVGEKPFRLTKIEESWSKFEGHEDDYDSRK
jgi:hypothetical protein